MILILNLNWNSIKHTNIIYTGNKDLEIYSIRWQSDLKIVEFIM